MSRSDRTLDVALAKLAERASFERVVSLYSRRYRLPPAEVADAVQTAFYKTLKWMEKATPEQIAANVPTEYHLGDKALYIRAVKNSQESYSRTGIVPEQGMKSIFDMLRTLGDLAPATEEETRGGVLEVADTRTHDGPRPSEQANWECWLEVEDGKFILVWGWRELLEDD